MARCSWGVVIWAGMLAGQWAAALADEPVFPPYGSAGSPPANVTQVPQSQYVPLRYGAPPVSASWPAQTAASAEDGIVRLPPTEDNAPIREFVGAATTAQPAVDGTWSEDANFITINMDGKELKLHRSNSTEGQNAAPPKKSPEGTVHGRLLQGGAPLINCHVVLVPMERHSMGAYSYHDDGEPLVGITDSQGVYYFSHVPPGTYKLTWLPEGTNQWIRRIEMRPDVTVRAGQDVTVKDIRAAQQTIN